MPLPHHEHDYLLDDPNIAQNERKVFWVVILTAVMMVIEVIFGYYTASMALLADGWHMASHAGALGIAYIAYKVARMPKAANWFSFGSGKLIPLGGYTSAVGLAMIAVLMLIESIKRLIAPARIEFDQAIVVAVIGLIVNVVCALILKIRGHDHPHHETHAHRHARHEDHNIRGAYLHVLADALTSVLAIAALVTGKFYRILWADALMGIVGSVIILKWAYGLCLNTGWELLDGHAQAIDTGQIYADLEDEHTKIRDLHVWRIAPNAYACELMIASRQSRGPHFYRELLSKKYPLRHIIVEETAL